MLHREKKTNTVWHVVELTALWGLLSLWLLVLLKDLKFLPILSVLLCRVYFAEQNFHALCESKIPYSKWCYKTLEDLSFKCSNPCRTHLTKQPKPWSGYCQPNKPVGKQFMSIGKDVHNDDAFYFVQSEIAIQRKH